MAQQTDHGARALSVRLWLACLATQELLASYLGIRLGLYESLAREGPATPPQLAGRTGIGLRYAREWLEQQAAAGIVTVDDPGRPADRRSFTLPGGHATVLTESDDPYSLAALAVLPVGGIAQALPDLLAAYRSGTGVPDAAFGADWRDGHSGVNRALFTHQLAGWIAGHAPDLHARLSADGARIADIACGAGWAGIALACAYPAARVDGVDLDPAIVAAAQRNASAAGVAGRVTFSVRDAADPVRPSSYDLVCLFDALHELPRPVDVLRACRALCAENGAVLVLDAKVAAEFVAPADEVERFQYATSVLHCLPACLAAERSAGTGTVMRLSTLRAYAARAGFARADVLPADDRFHRLYRLSG